MRVSTSTILAIGVVAVPALLAQEADDPLAVFKKADQAAKAVNAVTYHARFETEGGLPPAIRNVEGDVWLVSDGVKSSPTRMRADFQFTRTGSDNKVWRMRTAYDGTTIYVLDDSNKTSHASEKATVLGSIAGPVLQMLAMIEFIHPSPFQDEISADLVELTGTAQVGDVACHNLHVKYAVDQAEEAAWYISKTDYLPRRVDRYRPMPGGARMTASLVVTNLAVDPKISDDTFKLTSPEGYTKADSPAP